MSWQFDSPLRKIINNQEVYYPKCTNSSDYSGDYFRKIINDITYYIPLKSTNDGINIRKIINNNVYYYHNNTCQVTVYYDMTSSSPTSSSTEYTWDVTRIVFEMPLPVATSGSIVVSANTKDKSGNLLHAVKENDSNYPFSISATYNGVTVSGSTTLTTSGSITFTLS